MSWIPCQGAAGQREELPPLCFPHLLQDFSVFFEKLPPAVQDVQVLILEGLLREQDAARLVARHVRRKVLSSPQELPLPQTESMHGWPPPDI